MRCKTWYLSEHSIIQRNFWCSIISSTARGKGACFIYRTIYHEGILGLMRDFWLPSAAATQVSEWINCVYQDLKILNPAVGCLSVVVDYVRSPWVECLSPCLQEKKLGCWKSVLMKQFFSQNTDFYFLNGAFPFWRRWNWKCNHLGLKVRHWPKWHCRSFPNQQLQFCCLKKLKMRISFCSKFWV